MPLYFFQVRATPASQVELKEISAPDFVGAVQALAAWCPGIQIVRLEGIWVNRPAHA